MGDHTFLVKLMERDLRWIQEVGMPNWSCMVDGQEVELVMNDFPDEPLYTIKFLGSSVDLDDAPVNWSIPRA